MFVVEPNARNRRAHFVQGKSIKSICRELRVSRKTVRKVIRTEETDFIMSASSSRCRALASGERSSTRC